MSVEPLDLPIPKPATLVSINEHVRWLRMPLPFDLNHINLYLIRDDGDSWAVLDTGIGTDKTVALWEQIFDDYGLHISKVIVTHMHPDHIGCAGYLVEKFKVPLYMSFSEYFVARALVAGPRGASKWQDVDYLHKCGMPQNYIDAASSSKNSVGQVVKPIPLQFKRLVDKSFITMAGISWQIFIGRGHSPEHVCLYSEQLGVLISGDHILPQITPNIGAYSTEPEANPLSLYLQTLPQFKKLPNNIKVLPAHKHPFTDVHTRVDQLIEHHQKHLQNIMHFCSEARTVKEVLPVLFERELNPHNMFFAVAEALSHLNYLYYDGKLKRTLNAKGQWQFSAL